ncbi:MAG TPA: iron-containing redox enzyme family protein [Actinomycetota bacterium]|nr:iron-containing redox enzyme family protein [Actinomycetota bacterium]
MTPPLPGARAARLPHPRGPLSAFVLDALRGPVRRLGEYPPVSGDPLAGDDFHLALYVCYELHYAGFQGVDDAWEWEPGLLELRRRLEDAFEKELVVAVPPPEARPEEMPRRLRALADAPGERSLSKVLAAEPVLEQFREFVVHRSAYHLKEADPHSWAIPRVTGAVKTALLEIQHDEYGSGEPGRMHSELFAGTMRALGLDDSYGAYLDRLPGVTLGGVNLMSMFGLHRRWRGALVGHLALFEMTSTEPNRRYGDALRKLGYGRDATSFYDEHVEADAVHENIAAHDLAGGFARNEPDAAGDVEFGASCLLHLEERWADHLMDSWAAGRSSLL